MYAAAGVDAMELNFCCPFIPEGLEKDEANAFMGIYFTQHPDKGAEVIRQLKRRWIFHSSPRLARTDAFCRDGSDLQGSGRGWGLPVRQ